MIDKRKKRRSGFFFLFSPSFLFSIIVNKIWCTNELWILLSFLFSFSFFPFFFFFALLKKLWYYALIATKNGKLYSFFLLSLSLPLPLLLLFGKFDKFFILGKKTLIIILKQKKKKRKREKKTTIKIY